MPFTNTQEKKRPAKEVFLWTSILNEAFLHCTIIFFSKEERNKVIAMLEEEQKEFEGEVYNKQLSLLINALKEAWKLEDEAIS